MDKIQPLKGFRDFLPPEALKRRYIQQKVEATFVSYGFDPLETPALEYAETLLGKYGNEADKLLYLFEDRGGRKIGLRYDQTVPLSRVVAAYPDLPLPFKRYQIQPVWRAENPQRGRYREFLQCDIDTIGTNSYLADVEIIACTLDSLKRIGFAKPLMLVNDRTIFDQLGLTKTEVIIIDKLDKIGRQAVIDELAKSGRNDTEKLFASLESAQKTPRLTEIFAALEKAGFIEGSDFRFEPFLARGLDYYTSTIYEAKILDLTEPLSVAGGGRYDKLIGTFSGRDIPAVGIAFGFDRIVESAEKLMLLPEAPTRTLLLLCPLGDEAVAPALALANNLRKNTQTSTEVYPEPASKLDKQLKYANKKGVPFVGIIGDNEVREGKLTIKNMASGEQTALKFDQPKDIAAYVQKPPLL